MRVTITSHVTAFALIRSAAVHSRETPGITLRCRRAHSSDTNFQTLYGENPVEVAEQVTRRSIPPRELYTAAVHPNVLKKPPLSKA
jgi:hypothetical protein